MVCARRSREDERRIGAGGRWRGTVTVKRGHISPHLVTLELGIGREGSVCESPSVETRAAHAETLSPTPNAFASFSLVLPPPSAGKAGPPVDLLHCLPLLTSSYAGSSSLVRGCFSLAVGWRPIRKPSGGKGEEVREGVVE